MTSSSGSDNKCAIRIISSSSDKRVVTKVHEKLFWTYITEKLGLVHDYCIVENTDNYPSIILLDNNL